MDFFHLAQADITFFHDIEDKDNRINFFRSVDIINQLRPYGLLERARSLRKSRGCTITNITA